MAAQSTTRERFKIELDLQQLRDRCSRLVARQPPLVEVALSTAVGALQGGALGFVVGQLTKSSMAASAGSGGMSRAMAAQMQSVGGVWAQTRGLAALCGASSGLGTALKKLRKKEDVWSQMYSGAGGGAAYTIATGNFSIPAVMNTAVMLGGCNAAFFKVGQMFKPDYSDQEYEKGQYMLQTLGLAKYAKNLKRGSLVDGTIMLWNDSALKEVRIPPGPRLLILHHVDQYRNPSIMMSKRQPLPMLPSPPGESEAEQ